MRKIFFLLLFGASSLVMESCKDDGFPVPPATTEPQFTYTISNDGFAPATVTFTDNSVIPARAGNVSYAWSFGDGTTSGETNPVHLYSTAGVYAVKLVLVTTASAEVVEATQSIVVKDLNASGLPVFFTDGSTIYTALINDDAAIATSIGITTLMDSYGMAVDTINQKLYIADFDAGKILVANVDGTNLKDFRTGIGSPDAVAIDYADQKIYWDTDDGVRRADLTNTSLTQFEDFVTGQVNDPEGVSIDPVTHFVFWNNYDGGVWKKHVNGTGQAQIAAGEGGGSTIIINNKIYFDEYIASGDIRIKSANLDGTGVATVITGVSRVIFGLAYDKKSNKIYWGDRNNKNIMRANIDGSGAVIWFSGISTRGISIGKRKL